MKKTQPPEKRPRILVFGAHNDDHVVGAGGTLAKYSKEGKEVTVVVFSFGEMSLPLLKKKISISIRVKEARAAIKLLGEHKIMYLGLEEGRFEASSNDVKSTLRRIIRNIKPEKIFLHSNDDAHPDHRAVYNIVNSLLDEMKYKGEVYTFQVWNVLALKKRNEPQLVVDITDTFRNKTAAFRAHKSQLPAILSLTWNVYLQALLNGLKNRVRYAEVFHRVR